MHGMATVSTESHTSKHQPTKLSAFTHQGVVERLASTEGLTSESALLLFEDLKRFLFLCATTNERLVPTKPIDAAWHVFLLFTRDYAAFCADHLGSFVHHNPVHQPQEQAMLRGQRTYELAKQRWGTLSENWSYAVGAGDCPTTCED